MAGNDAVWKDEYNVGVDYVDEAHRKLFSVLRKMVALYSENDTQKNRHASVEAVKFLKSYTVKHFQEEEAYMLKIGYEGYSTHKSLHDNLRENTLPALEKELLESDFSKEAIGHFIGIFVGWLSGHILIEDRAITGRMISRWNRKKDADRAALLCDEFVHFMKDIAGYEFTLSNAHYEGVPFGKAVYCRLEYKENITITMACQEKIILSMAGTISGKDFTFIDNNVALSYAQLFKSMGDGILATLYPEKAFNLVSQKKITDGDLRAGFKTGFPAYSYQWQCKDGYFALCVDER